jgi:hypothetical protein
MKRYIVFALSIMLLTLPVYCQYPIGTAQRVVAYRGTLPAQCNPLTGDIAALTSGAGSIGLYSCVATNTWKAIGNISNQFLITQGTITTSKPFISQTATWNAGGVTFTNLFSNVTDTASAAASLLMDLQIGAASKFKIDKTGIVTVADAGQFVFGARSILKSSANGLFTVSNNAGTDFTRLNLGPVAVTHPGITVSAAVGGQTQGIIITKADGTSAAFGDLGAATNGSMIYCSNCTIASPCAGGGTGAIAKRLNGAWVCN